jgi:hypothetical protein
MAMSQQLDNAITHALVELHHLQRQLQLTSTAMEILEGHVGPNDDPHHEFARLGDELGTGSRQYGEFADSVTMAIGVLTVLQTRRLSTPPSG